MTTHTDRSPAGFACTQCAKCCHGLRVPLGHAEAIAWLERGGEVVVACEAIPWPGEPDPSNGFAAYKRSRSFAGHSGALPVRVIATLLASFEQACPNLAPDGRCGIYADRPQACRIYPFEVNPFIALDTRQKLCPPDAWAAPDAEPPAPDPTTTSAMTARRQAAQDDVELANLTVAWLQLDVAAMSNDGSILHHPDRATLLAALRDAVALAPTSVPARNWRVASSRATTLEALHACHGDVRDMRGCDASQDGFLFVDFSPKGTL